MTEALQAIVNFIWLWATWWVALYVATVCVVIVAFAVYSMIMRVAR